MTARFAIALSLGVLLAAPVAAQVTPTVLLDENFDTYADQTAFEATWPPFFNTTLDANHPSMTLSTEQAVSGPNSAKNPGVTSTAGTAASPRNQRFFTDSGLPAVENLVHFEFDFFDTAPDVSPYRSFTGIFNSAAPSSSGGLIQIGLNNNQTLSDNGGNYYMGRVFGYDPLLDGESVGGNGAFFKLNGPGAPLRSLGWHKLGVTISDIDFKFYVDDILARTVLRSTGFNGTPVTVRSFDEIRLGSGISNNDTASYVDNLKVILNPELVVPPTGDADFDADGDIDGDDFLAWQRGFGINDGTALPANGDADGDMNVTAADLDIWKTQFGTTPPPATAAVGAVPEPASATLAVAAALAGLALTRRRSQVTV